MGYSWLSREQTPKIPQRGSHGTHVPRNDILRGIFFSLGTPKDAEDKWIRPSLGFNCLGHSPGGQGLECGHRQGCAK